MRVVIRNIEKVFPGPDKHRALDRISMNAEAGELLVLLGPSGSGKTTLLRAIAGLETVDSGDIEFDGRRVNDLDPGRRNIGMVFQDYALYPHLNVYSNVAYNMKIRRLSRNDIDERVNKVAKMLRIDRLLGRKPSELSGGQRQRVAVARAVTRDASVLLMDEPLSNLDAQIREHVRVELRELQRLIGVTTIYVTHDQVEAMVMADRIAVMADGRVEQIGVPDEVYGRPDTLFCARFMGSPKINELEGVLSDDPVGGLSFAIGPDGRGAVLRLAPERAPPGGFPIPTQPATLTFRAEDAVITNRTGCGVNADVTFIENRGAEKYLLADLAVAGPFRDGRRSVELRLRLYGADRPDESGKVWFLPNRVHLFCENGRRLLTASCREIPADVQLGPAALINRASSGAAAT